MEYEELVSRIFEMSYSAGEDIYTGAEVGLWNSIGFYGKAMGLQTTPASKSSFICSLVPSGSAVDVLLATARTVRLSLFSLNFTAILTTILGSYLALLSTVTDFVNEKNSDEEETGTESQSKLQEGRGNNSLLSRIKVASIISVPASLIACSSPSIFLRAIDFAGSYPVLMLCCFNHCKASSCPYSAAFAQMSNSI